MRSEMVSCATSISGAVSIYALPMPNAMPSPAKQMTTNAKTSSLSVVNSTASANGCFGRWREKSGCFPCGARTSGERAVVSSASLTSFFRMPAKKL